MKKPISFRTGAFAKRKGELLKILINRGAMSKNQSKIGYIKLHRSSEENELYFAEPFTRWQAWQDLILLTSHKDTFFFARGVEIHLKKGQLGWAVKSLSKRWCWSYTKVNSFLEFLKKRGQIEYQKNNVTTIITVINWDKYQGDEKAEVNQKETRSKPEVNQKETYKNVKNVKNNIYVGFTDLFISITGKQIKTLNEKTKGQINARLNDGYTLEDMEQAIRNCKSDKYHIENPQYLTPEFITRADKMEKYLLATAAPEKVLTSEEFFGV